MHTDPRPDGQPNRPQCWCCANDLHRQNVALFLDAERKAFVPVCCACWELLTPAERLDYAMRYDEHRRKIAEQRLSVEQQGRLNELIEEWIKVGHRVNEMREGSILTDDDDPPDWLLRGGRN